MKQPPPRMFKRKMAETDDDDGSLHVEFRALKMHKSAASEAAYVDKKVAMAVDKAEDREGADFEIVCEMMEGVELG